jgi:DnaJ-class molecular chaperone
MMDSPYAILGVEPVATEDQIRAAYRKLAKQHHPDLNPGNASSEERFKKISAAYAILSDPEKRGRFDRGEIDASGAERPPERQYYRDFGDDGARAKYRSDVHFDPDDLESIFAQAFRGRQSRSADWRGEDAVYALTVDFLDAARGVVRRLTLPDGRTLDVTVPAGLADGQILRLKGQGGTGTGKGPAGDALVQVSVSPHALFKRDGNDIRVEIPVTLQEAMLGAKIQVPTIAGQVHVTVPARSTTGTILRLKGKGIAGGNQYVTLKVVLPAEPEPELVRFLETWKPEHPQEPRRGMELL